MARTTKPCPACKIVYSYRSANEICDKCRKLINEAEVAREKAHTAKGTELVRLPWAAHSMGNIPHSSVSFGEDFGQNIRVTLYAICPLVSTPSPSESGHNIPVVIGGGREPVRMTKGLRELFNTLYANIQLATQCAYDEGYSDGHNMLVRLAKGEMSREDFDEIGTGDSLSRQPARRKKR